MSGKHRKAAEREANRPRPAEAVSPPRQHAARSPAGVLALQRLVGNAATTRLLGGEPPVQRMAEPGQLRLVGRLGQPPVFRLARDESLVGNFSLEVNLEPAGTEWHRIVVGGAAAEELQRQVDAGGLTRGSEVEVLGRLRTLRYQNEAGEWIYRTEIEASTVSAR